MSSIPTYVQKPLVFIVQISTANAGRDGTGTIGSLATVAAEATGVAAGIRVDRITAKATVTTTAGVLRLYVSLDGGTTKRLFQEILVSAVTPSATVAAFTGTFTLPANGMYLPPNSQLSVSTERAETFNIVAEGACL